MVLKVLLVPKRQQTTRVGEDVMKLEFSYTSSGNVNGSSTMENGGEMAQEYSDINYHIALQFNIPIYLKGKGRYKLICYRAISITNVSELPRYED